MARLGVVRPAPPQPCAAQYCCSRATASWKVQGARPRAHAVAAGKEDRRGGLGLGSRAATAGPAVLCAAPAAARQRAGVLWGAALAAAAHLPEQRHSSVTVVLRSKGAESRTWDTQALPFFTHQAAKYSLTRYFSLESLNRIHCGCTLVSAVLAGAKTVGVHGWGMPMLDQALLAPAQSAGPHWPHQCTEQAAAAPALRQLAQEPAQLKRPRRNFWGILRLVSFLAKHFYTIFECTFLPYVLRQQATMTTKCNY